MSDSALTDLSPVLTHAVKQGQIFDAEGLYDAPVAQFYDLDLWDSHLRNCKEAFGNTFQHCMALKSNSISRNVQHVQKVHGFGVECASIGEVQHAILHCGVPKDKVIFDSPCKTKAELEYALREKIHLNLDNFAEYERAKKFVTANLSTNESFDTGVVGMRINPLVGAGEIAALSVSTTYSKFAIPCTEKERILECYRQSPWLNSVMVHVGSGGMGVTLLSAGIRVAVNLAKDINAMVSRQQVTSIDIGGGLPANYNSDSWGSAKVPTYNEYADHLRQNAPELFTGEFKVYTEFGQSMNAKCGFLASRIEWMKGTAEEPIPIVHFGADSCVRQCYTNEHGRRIEAYRKDGSRFPHDHAKMKMDVGGPLCFSGDFIGKGVDLPSDLEAGDIIVMKDAGANTLSIFSRHCSRLCPPVYGYRWSEDRSEVKEIIQLKPREKVEQLSAFWGPLQ